MKFLYTIFPLPIGFALVCVVWTTGCNTDTNRAKVDTEKPFIVATTGMIADAIVELVDTAAVVKELMGPGVDPHLYKATQRDLALLRQADLIFYNGLHLEGKMGEVLEKLGREKPVFAIADGVPPSRLIQVDAVAGSYDPHIWFDVSIWRGAVTYIKSQLSDTYPELDTFISLRYERYVDSLDDLHTWVQSRISTIPRDKRVMITAHDAFEYFGQAYDIEVRGLQGISTVAEFGLKDVKNLVDLIVYRKVESVFVETSVPSKSLEAVVAGCRERGHDIQIGGTLYSDAMGEPGTPEGKYVGMVKSNVNTIVEGLK